MSQERTGESFGATLRAARERRGVTLRQISNATKISVGVLEALERSDFSRLPGGIFSRAFIRSYASEVGLDPDKTIQEFLSQLPAESPLALAHRAAEPIEDHAAVASDQRAATTWLRLVLVSVPVAAMVAYLGMRGPKPKQPVEPAVAESSSQAIATPPAAEPASPPSEAADDRPLASVAEVAPGAVPVTAGVDAVETLSLGVSVSRVCWLSLTVDGQRIMGRLLQPGEQRTIEASREVVMTVGDAGAVQLVVNGAEARPIGRPGEVVTIRLTPANYRQYLLAR